MNSFSCEVWPEDPTPKEQLECRECGLYRQGSRMVWGEGNPRAPILVILDNPGVREDRERNPMVCGTRQTLQQALHEVGLSKDTIYVTYILKRRPVRKYDKEQVRSICMHHLEKQLENQNPSLIICLGNVAVQSFFKNSEVDVKSLRGSWHDVGGYQTAVAYHPLAVRRRPNLYPKFAEDLSFAAEKFRLMQ
ncbi:MULTISPECIES: uracil-DNA glycosylase [unclassified Sporosarcina]|uniref:uracil-DNA glycosylase n=1 Tax=unclassified Sporosarcina TaxID=2647733 RepID=UPI00204153B5|nr:MULTISPECIES: uracil-DNA glycosylase [unclassified Sporosarcina]GKV67321.1 uracil-DNA glycosylase [Sporosarcina sp. NCCP-2331]GLB57681.1 uracil-DNA glycosylase [Sporosarcina sp. NCCP-2378]